MKKANEEWYQLFGHGKPSPDQKKIFFYALIVVVILTFIVILRYWLK